MLKVYPVVGTKYFVTEWDNSRAKVTVIGVSKVKDEVSFEYEDGLVNTVTADYFAVGLNAAGIR